MEGERRPCINSQRFSILCFLCVTLLSILYDQNQNLYTLNATRSLINS